ncbi:MAG: hypothetical protein ABIH00_06550, partial [Armatimonadota bacterium]
PNEALTANDSFSAVNVELIPANINITSPVRDTGVAPGQEVNITVAMNPRAVGVAQRILVSFMRNNRSVAELNINNPQANNQAVLRVPADTAPGELLIRAYAFPNEALTANDSFSAVNVER